MLRDRTLFSCHEPKGETSLPAPFLTARPECSSRLTRVDVGLCGAVFKKATDPVPGEALPASEEGAPAGVLPAPSAEAPPAAAQPVAPTAPQGSTLMLAAQGQS